MAKQIFRSKNKFGSKKILGQKFLDPKKLVNFFFLKNSRLCEVGGVPIIVAKLNRPLFGFEIMVSCLLGQL